MVEGVRTLSQTTGVTWLHTHRRLFESDSHGTSDYSYCLVGHDGRFQFEKPLRGTWY